MKPESNCEINSHAFSGDQKSMKIFLHWILIIDIDSNKKIFTKKSNFLLK